MNTIVPRKRDFAFSDGAIPRWWMGGSAVGTHMANALNLVFPMGERFFVRSVRRYLDDIADDPQLVERVRGFSSQEGHHAYAHERFFGILREQGYDVDRFLRVYQRIAWDAIEPNLNPVISLSVTVALEHYTAMFAERALTRDFLEHAPPVMRDLLRWHAAEEIEHKDVAFDVLERVDPRYLTRLAGMLLATLGLTGFWILGTVMLLREEKLPAREILRQFGALVASGRIANGDMQRAFIAYLKPGFHPRQIANYDLARDYLATVGIESTPRSDLFVRPGEQLPPSPAVFDEDA